MKIIPASLRTDLDEILKDISNLNKVCDLVSIDLCDGIFVPSQTWLPNEKDLNEKQKDKKIFSEMIKNQNLEFDLMVIDLPKYLNLVLEFGASRVVIHSNDAKVISACIDLIRKRREEHQDNFTEKNIVNFNFINFKLGLCSDQENILQEFASQVDYIQIMGIEKLGFQQQPFSENTLQKIQNIRKFYDGIIQIDGGMNLINIRKCLAAGANNFVVGSAIFGHDNPAENYKKIVQEI